jgi:hypothetical protein
MHAERKRLADAFKESTPKPLRSRIYNPTPTLYGDPLGPRIDDLREKEKSWDDIIERAARPSRPISGDFRHEGSVNDPIPAITEAAATGEIAARGADPGEPAPGPAG